MPPSVVERFNADLQALHNEVGACDARDWALRTPRYQQFSILDHDYTQRFLRILWDWRDMLRSRRDSSRTKRAIGGTTAMAISVSRIAGQVSGSARLARAEPSSAPSWAWLAPLSPR